jgi:hypothetical protein
MPLRLLGDQSIDDIISPSGIEAIEIYQGIYELPAEFLGPRGANTCGAISIWTRRS